MNSNQLIARIKTLISRLEGGLDVSNSSLARVLSAEQFLKIQEDWEEELVSRTTKRPKVLKKYEEMIKVGILHHQRMERYSQIPNKGNIAKIFSNKAEDVFERSIEYLTEQLQADPSLRMWIDRNPDGVSLCPIGIPRIIGSSSPECLIRGRSPSPKNTKREIKLRALEHALSMLLGSDKGAFCETESFVRFSRSKTLDFSTFTF